MDANHQTNNATNVQRSINSEIRRTAERTVPAITAYCTELNHNRCETDQINRWKDWLFMWRAVQHTLCKTEQCSDRHWECTPETKRVNIQCATMDSTEWIILEQLNDCALILPKTWRYTSHLLTYLLTYWQRSINVKCTTHFIQVVVDVPLSIPVFTTKWFCRHIQQLLMDRIQQHDNICTFRLHMRFELHSHWSELLIANSLYKYSPAKFAP